MFLVDFLFVKEGNSNKASFQYTNLILVGIQASIILAILLIAATVYLQIDPFYSSNDHNNSLFLRWILFMCRFIAIEVAAYYGWYVLAFYFSILVLLH